MRKAPTRAEKLLWGRLKGARKDGLRFRRQHAIFPYIVDLVCLEALLIVEIDGENHNWEGQKDKARRAALEDKGFSFVRFSNFEVMSNPRECAIAVLRAAYAKIPRLLTEIDSLTTW